MMVCNICGSESNNFGSARILGKYLVRYYCCSECGFVQTEYPYWLDEAYSNVFTAVDTGTMKRNMDNATDLLFFMRFIEDGSCLDFGGAYGVLTRIMRDYGFDFYSYDKYAQNLFASGFDGDLTKKYALVTSFENFEHFVNPMDEIEKIISITETLYFTTQLISSPPPDPNDNSSNHWWYYIPIEGQHIHFYTKKALEFIGNKHGMYLLSDNIGTHILSKEKINKNYFFLLRQYNRINRYINIARLLKKETKTYSDMNIIIKKNKPNLQS
jgi:hypothetical protein